MARATWGWARAFVKARLSAINNKRWSTPQSTACAPDLPAIHSRFPVHSFPTFGRLFRLVMFHCLDTVD
jgi:hypothetical protein